MRGACQIWNAHAPVPTTGWEAMKIPLPEEVPGIDIEVVVRSLRLCEIENAAVADHALCSHNLRISIDCC